MTAAHLTVAHCGEVSALTLGLPASAAIPEQKGTLPKGLFVAKAPVSSKLKQRLVNDIASITMPALLRPANTAMGAGSGKMPEVLVIGLRVNTPGIPVEVIDLIAGQRKSGIVFVCVHEGEFEGAVREECALAVRRNVPVRAGPCRSCADHESVLRRMEAGRRGHAGTTGGTPTAARRRWTTCGIRCARRRFSIPRTEPIWTRESPAGTRSSR